MTFEEFAKEVHEMAAGRYSYAGLRVGFNGCDDEWTAYTDDGACGVSAAAASAIGCLEKFRQRLATEDK